MVLCNRASWVRVRVLQLFFLSICSIDSRLESKILGVNNKILKRQNCFQKWFYRNRKIVYSFKEEVSDSFIMNYLKIFIPNLSSTDCIFIRVQDSCLKSGFFIFSIAFLIQEKAHFISDVAICVIAVQCLQCVAILASCSPDGKFHCLWIETGLKSV